MTDGEIKGMKFLKYVAENEKKLKRNLKKNITFDTDLFDDIFQESIIKVYNTIVKNNKDIDDYDFYFFTSSKFNYILKQNKEREKLKNKVGINDFLNCDENCVEPETYCEIDTRHVMEMIRAILEKQFGKDDTEIYFDYIHRKLDGGMSYEKYSQLTGIPVRQLTNTISNIKRFCKNDRDINRIKNALY